MAQPQKKEKPTFASEHHIKIAVARCNTHLQHVLNPPETKKAVTTLRDKLKPLKLKEKKRDELMASDASDTEKKKKEKEFTLTAAEKKKKEELEGKIKQLREDVVRSGTGCGVVLAKVLSDMTKSLTLHAMRSATASDRKIIDVDSLLDGDLTQNPYWGLVRRCPTVVNYSAEAEEELKKERAQEEKDRQKAKEDKREVPPKKKDHDLPMFGTYADGIIGIIRKENEEYEKARVSKRFREVLSDIIAEVITRVGSQLRNLVLTLMGARTLYDKHVLYKVNELLADEIGDADKVQAIMDPVAKIMTDFQKYCDEEKKRKDEEKESKLTDEEKEARDKKLREKKQKALQAKIEAKKEAATKAVEDAKSLAKDLNELKV